MSATFVSTVNTGISTSPVEFDFADSSARIVAVIEERSRLDNVFLCFPIVSSSGRTSVLLEASEIHSGVLLDLRLRCCSLEAIVEYFRARVWLRPRLKFLGRVLLKSSPRIIGERLLDRFRFERRRVVERERTILATEDFRATILGLGIRTMLLSSVRSHLLLINFRSMLSR